MRYRHTVPYLQLLAQSIASWKVFGEGRSPRERGDLLLIGADVLLLAHGEERLLLGNSFKDFFKASRAIELLLLKGLTCA